MSSDETLADTTSSPARPQGKGPTRARPLAWIATGALLGIAAVGGGFGIGRATAGSQTSGRGDGAPSSPRAAATSPTTGTGGQAPGPTPAALGGGDTSLANFIGQQAGKALAGLAPLTVDPARAQQLGRQSPAGAIVDHEANSVTFVGANVSFVVEAVPPGAADMTFRIAGLTNPQVVVPAGATVTVEIVNADPDEAHGWEVTAAETPIPFRVGTPVSSSAAVPVLGDPTSGGDGAAMTSFVAPPGGTYQYLCPMPGHAEMGMHGAFTVR